MHEQKSITHQQTKNPTLMDETPPADLEAARAASERIYAIGRSGLEKASQGDPQQELEKRCQKGGQ